MQKQKPTCVHDDPKQVFSTAKCGPHKARMEGGRQQPLLKRYTYILGVVAAYWTVSITLVFVNKSLLSGAQKLDAPLFITCYQCVITVAACYVLRYVSQMKLTLIQPKHCWYLAVQAFTLHRWAATKLPNLVSFPELTVDPSILKQVTRNEMSRSFIQTFNRCFLSPSSSSG